MPGNDFSKMNTPALGQSSDRALLEAWQRGNQHAADMLVQRYLVRLTALARSRLSHKLRRRVDPEDVVQSAWRSFFVAAQKPGALCASDDNLWPLLLTFTLRKMANTADHHTAQRRDPANEVSWADSSWSAEIIAREPSPQTAAELVDEVETLLSQFDLRDRDILVRRFQGETIEEIVAAIGVSDRTIRRVLERARGWLQNAAYHSTVVPREITDELKSLEPYRELSHEIPQWTYQDLLLEQYLGGGGFGKVYRARNRNTGEIVAVKFLRKLWWNDGTAVAALLHEASLLRQIHDDRIANCRGWGRTPHGAMFLVLDWIAGESLASWRDRVEPEISEIVHAVQSVAEIVGQVHEHGVLHGDLKPDNILRTACGRVVLTDFGMSRRIKPTGWEVPRGGTAGFLAPEQCSEAFGLITERTDVYGLGALLFSLLTDRPPHAGRDVPEILALVISEEPAERLSHRFAGISPKLDDFVSRCLSKRPEERPASARQFLMELQSIQDEQTLLTDA